MYFLFITKQIQALDIHIQRWFLLYYYSQMQTGKAQNKIKVQQNENESSMEDEDPMLSDELGKNKIVRSCKSNNRIQYNIKTKTL